MPSYDASGGRIDRERAAAACRLWMALLAWLVSFGTAAAEPWAARLSPMLGSVPASPPPAVDWPANLNEPAVVNVQQQPPAAGPSTGSSSYWPTVLPGWPEASTGPVYLQAEFPSHSYGGWETVLPDLDTPLWDYELGASGYDRYEVIDVETFGGTGDWTWQVMPLGLLYRSYLAGAKESRFSSYWNRERELGQLWDASLGGRLGLLRYGTCDPIRPEGWQIDVEGGSQARMDPTAHSTPLLSVDFRIGIPVTWARGPWQFKTGYYHISAHLGDEFLLLNPDARRLNYVRDSLMLAFGYFWTERLRLYCEAAYAVNANDGAEPWEFQFGADWAPEQDTGLRGAPFAAVNAHLREELNFGGNLVLQAGWAWRRYARGSLFRTGLQYYRGKSDQYEYYDHSERRLGWGMWADF